MTTTFRRSTGPPSVFDRSEETRIADRKRLFRELAERKEREASLRSLEAALRELDGQSDVAADAHAAAAEPLQAELAEPSITAARRTKLLAELAKLNETLESKIKSVKAIRNPLERQKRELLSLITSATAIEGQIQRSAPLQDQAASWASLRGLKFASERMAAAMKAERIAADELKVAQSEPGKYDLIQFERRAGQWAAEVESAGRMLDAAKAESDAAQSRLMVDE